MQIQVLFQIILTLVVCRNQNIITNYQSKEERKLLKAYIQKRKILLYIQIYTKITLARDWEENYN